MSRKQRRRPSGSSARSPAGASTEPSPGPPVGDDGSALEVFLAFLRLGLTSFGGPVAHLGYFRRELVERRRWATDSEFGQLLAMCQFLPGPASSQLGFSLGMLRAGFAGGLAAFVAFTLPSAVLLVAFAGLLPWVAGPTADAALHGLKVVALVVVAHGVFGMARKLSPDLPRAAISVCSVALLLFWQQPYMQLVAIALGGVAGFLLCRGGPSVIASSLRVRYSVSTGWVLLALFAGLLIGLPMVQLAWPDDGQVLWAAVTGFYRAGALVFGGGHVVLPLLDSTVVGPGWISANDFLAGYGAAQAIPGPMFSLSAYLGFRLPGAAGGITGAGAALLAIFIPGMLLVAGVLPFWQSLAARPLMARAIAGVNAAVVGLLGAAMYDPVWTSAVRGPGDIMVALVGLGLLFGRNVSVVVVVGWCVAASMILPVMDQLFLLL